MKSTHYSEKMLDHFRNPRNVGILAGEDVVAGETGSHVNGDLMKIYLKVADDTIADVKFQTFGCGSAIATSSMITEMVKGKTLDEALLVAPQDVVDELDGLPPAKMHCSNLAVDALREAINNFKSQKGYG
jgi:nitrogen fixation NifU-like protein